MLRLHRVPALVCSWWDSSGIKLKAFWAWLSVLLDWKRNASQQSAGLGCRSGLPRTTGRLMQSMVWPAGEGLPRTSCVCSACRRLSNDVCYLQRRWSYSLPRSACWKGGKLVVASYSKVISYWIKKKIIRMVRYLGHVCERLQNCLSWTCAGHSLSKSWAAQVKIEFGFLLGMGLDWATSSGLFQAVRVDGSVWQQLGSVGLAVHMKRSCFSAELLQIPTHLISNPAE